MTQLTPTDEQPVCILVHGVKSGPNVWDHLLGICEIEQDTWPDFRAFHYRTGILKLKRTSRLPTQHMAAEQLRTFIQQLDRAGPIVLVGHSQGGLVIQRLLCELLSIRDETTLARIRRVLLFACPNFGSDSLRLLRRLFTWRNRQERQLRVFDEDVNKVHRQVVRDFAGMQASHPIEFHVYLGAEDNVVSPVSAQGLFPNTQTLPGDHSTILVPPTAHDQRWTAFRLGVLIYSRVDDVTTGRQPAILADKAPGRLEMVSQQNSDTAWEHSTTGGETTTNSTAISAATDGEAPPLVNGPLVNVVATEPAVVLRRAEHFRVVRATFESLGSGERLRTLDRIGLSRAIALNTPRHRQTEAIAHAILDADLLDAFYASIEPSVDVDSDRETTNG